MRSQPQEFTYTLTDSESITFADSDNNNEPAETREILLIPPSRNNRQFQNQIIQMVIQALQCLKNSDMGANQSDSPKDIPGVSGDESTLDEMYKSEYIMFILLNSNVDIERVIQSVFKIFKQGHAKLDGKVTVTDFHLHMLSNTDCYAIVGEYIGNFLQHSWFANMMTNMTKKD